MGINAVISILLSHVVRLVVEYCSDVSRALEKAARCQKDNHCVL